MFKIFTVIRKEITDLLRDRRTMFFMIVFPSILIPLIIGGFSKFTSTMIKKEMDKKLRIAIIGSEFDEKLISYLSKDKKLKLINFIEELELEKNILNQTIDAGIVIPNDTQEKYQQMKPVDLKLFFRSAKGENINERRINDILDEYYAQILESRYIKLKIDKDFLKPFSLEKIDVASNQEKFGKTIGTFLPYLFLILCFTGAMYPALDLGAGEKERGTLETILTSPANNIEILSGKFIVVSIFAIMSVLFGLLGMLFAVKINTQIPQEIVTVAINILGAKPVILMLSLLIPIALFFSSFLLAVSFYARTFKEAQSIMGPLNMLIIVPIMIGLMPGVSLNVSTAWIPILNVSLAMNDIIAGTLSWTLYFEVMFSLLFFTFCSIWLSVKFISREEVIFRG